jgi:DNA end-binding protein Ku
MLADRGQTGTMPRAIWSGAISFGLVNVPVKLVAAVQPKDVRFNQLEAGTGQRVRQKRVSSVTGEEVPYDQIVKGYEIAPDQYVVVTPEELAALDPKATRTIDIEDFVELAQIDPLYYEHAYYLVPETAGRKAYVLLRETMRRTGKVGIGRVVLRTKQYLAVIRPREQALVLETLYYADEVVDESSLELPTDVELSERELDIARQLVESLATDFDPTRYRDTYREEVLALIEAKAAGRQVVTQIPAAEEEGEVVDLMAALERSLAAVRAKGA